MFGADLNAAEILDRLVPVPAAEGDWSAVVRDAIEARQDATIRAEVLALAADARTALVRRFAA